MPGTQQIQDKCNDLYFREFLGMLPGTSQMFLLYFNLLLKETKMLQGTHFFWEEKKKKNKTKQKKTQIFSPIFETDISFVALGELQSS